MTAWQIAIQNVTGNITPEPENGRCLWCGKALIPTKRGAKYCDVGCGEKYRAQQKVKNAAR